MNESQTLDELMATDQIQTEELDYESDHQQTFSNHEVLKRHSHHHNPHQPKRGISFRNFQFRKILVMLKKIATGGSRSSLKGKKRKASYESVFGSSFEGDLDGDEAHVRIKPEAIEKLVEMTKFSKKELQTMYRGFKNDCPSGLVKEETFKLIYAQFFPRGADSSAYAHFVFSSFDTENSGGITFTDFVLGLSALARGSIQDKLRWTFALYDLDGDGILSRDELYRIISAIYDLLGRPHGVDLEEEAATREHADRVFQRLDLNQDGIITIEQFLDSCLRDENITKSLAFFNTNLS